MRANESTSPTRAVINPAGPIDRGEHPGRRRHRVLSRLVDVPDRSPVQQRLLGQRHRPLEPERLDQALAKRPVPRQRR